MALEVIEAAAVIVDFLVVDLDDAPEPVHGVHQLRYAFLIGAEAFLIGAEQLFQLAEAPLVLFGGIHLHVRPQFQGMRQSLQPLINRHAYSIVVARKVSPLEMQLDRLADLRKQPASPAGCAELIKNLAGKHNLPAAKAARIAGEWGAAELAPQLVGAFDRFLVKPETTDKRCEAKIEILKALCRFAYSSPGVFRRGIRHVQMEGAWGPPVDTAAPVRALSAMGLAQTHDPDALEEIVPLLLDKEVDARIGAVRAIAVSNRPGDTLLLRLKALSGDQPEVLGECFAALLRCTPDRSIEFVARFLDHTEEAIAEAAALALGDSRVEGAFDALRAALERTRPRSVRRTLLLAIALLRRENALDHLLALVRNADEETSEDAAAALATYAEDPSIRERLEQARGARLTRLSDTQSER